MNTNVGDHIDAVDSIQKWCLGEVVAKDETAVRIHFDGWSSKWDVTQRWTSYKISPFRRYSKGYTGQPKTPLRNSMHFDIEACREERIRVDKMVHNDFRGNTAHELTQYLRGKLFVYIDFIMGQATYTEAEADEIYELLRAAVRLIVAWLKKMPSIMQKSLQDLKKYPDLFLVDEDLALFNCSCELMGTLKSIFCGCHRTIRYYLHWDRNQEVFQTSVAKDYTSVDFAQRRTPPHQEADINQLVDMVSSKATNLTFGAALNLLNYFYQLGGF